MTVITDRTIDAGQDSLTRARRHLLRLQHARGYWKGELETNVTIDAEDLFLAHFLGLERPAETRRTALWIRAHQREDGSWATFHGGPGDLSTSAEAYVALRLAGDPADAAHMSRAAAFIRDAGGVESTRVFTRMWLSLLGLWSWASVPTLPPEQILLPPRAPLSVYSFGCWARQTIVALSVVTALTPSAAVGFAIDELRTGAQPRQAPDDLWGRLFLVLDRAAHLYGRHAPPPLRRAALRRAERWIVERQERDGSWGGIQPPWVWSIVALRALGYDLDHPVLARALSGLGTFTIDDEHGRRIEACQSPVWDTALALLALLDAGVPAGEPALRRAAEWLVAQEVGTRGDWAVRRRALAPGGFPFEFANDNYPDVDDTAVVLLALRRSGIDTGGAPERGLSWMLGMQSRSGGWGAFDVDNTSNLCARLAFCDFGAVTDPPSADVTAHVLETLAYEERAGERPAQRGLAWLLERQERDGAWFGRWGANYVYGTGAVLPALAACGLDGHPSIAAGRSFLEAVQNEDGGFGEDLRSYRDDSWRGRGASTASQTAWGLLGLHASGAGQEEAAAAAIRYLIESQREDGGWDEPYYTGTGFPGDFYLNYHLYRDVFPVMALGRILGERGVSARLLVLAPLRVERLALAGLTGAQIVRTGMGPARARRAAAAAQTAPADAIAVAGLCAALAPGLEPGDVVCADTLRADGEPPLSLPGAELVAASLARHGLRVHVGSIVSSAHLEGPRARRLRRGEGLALDMESAWLAAAARGRPLAVVRVVVDADGRGLADPRIVVAGLRALAGLRSAGVALRDWADALEPQAAPRRTDVSGSARGRGPEVLAR